MVNKIRYEEFTWPEIREAVAENRVAVMPIGTVEQHGRHLPLVTDVVTSTEVARRAVEQMPHEAVLMPSIFYSFNIHHMDFPGTIAVEGPTIINYVTDIGKSLAYHGFRKILLVNGHGSNVPFMDIAARNITNNTEAACGLISWWSLIPPQLFRELRESEIPGGMAHACELETSALMYLRGDLVQMDKADREINLTPSEFFFWDLETPSRLIYQEWASRNTTTGTFGDPTKASVAKGEKFVTGAVERLKVLLKEFRARELRPRVDHH